MFKNWIVFILVILVSASLKAQNLSFEAVASKTEVSVNERFVVQFILTYGQELINVDKALDLPDFGGLHQLGESQISSVKILNRTAINQTGVEVILVADREGEYTIPPTFIVINGKKLKSDPIKITVKKGLKETVPSGQRVQGAFIMTEISNENPFLNQEVVLVVRAYARDYPLLNRMRNFKEPDFNDLIVKYVSERPDNNEKQVLINGTTFISKEIARYVVFPQKNGEIAISPFSIDVLVSGYFGMESVTLTSNDIKLNTKNLPDKKPKNFSGAVGDFTMNTSISKKQLKSNESVQLEVEIIGSGNFNALKMPDIESPEEHLKSFSPKVRDAYEIRPSGMKGKLIKNQIFVPQYGGKYTIPPVEFSFFNPDKEKYVQLKSDAFTLQVDGPLPPSKDSVIAKNENSEELNPTENFTETNIANVFPERIKEVKNQVVDSVSQSPNRLWLIGLGSIAFVLLFFVIRRKNKRKPVVLSEKEIEKALKKEVNRKLNDLKLLKEQGNTTAFLSLQEEILTQIGMFYGETTLSDFTEESVEAKMKIRLGELASEWKELLLKCKQYKYASGSSEFDISALWKETKELWGFISKK